MNAVLLGFSVAMALWAIALALTGGFTVDLGALHVASRRPRNPAIVSIVFAVIWLMRSARSLRDPRAVSAGLARRVDRAAVLLRPLRSWTAPIIAGVVAIGVVFFAGTQGAFVAGGSDSYGYVSQAHLWRTGDLFLKQPLATEMPWPFTDRILAPLGYQPSPTHPGVSVPTYAPGLPMVMAIFEWIGGKEAVFYVVPLLAGLAIVATYVMGTRLAGQEVGVFAIVLLATSPPFVLQSISPMSDVPAAAWWTISLASLLFDRPWAAGTGGLAAAAAILTRPNLAPLAAFPMLWLVRQALVDGRDRRRDVLRVGVFAAGVAGGCVAVSALNRLWYGSAIQSGYGPLGELYDWGYFWPNVERYSGWLVETHTPIVLAALLAPFVVRRGTLSNTGAGRHALAYVICLMCFMGGVAVSYLFYTPFEPWWYLRFLLPALPALFVLTALTLCRLGRLRLERLRLPLLTVLVALIAWHNFNYAVDRGILNVREGERKYIAIGEHISRHLPEQAVLLALQYSGSVRYYSGRQTLRYDWINPSALDEVIANLVEHGHRPYLLVEKSEEQEFRDRFAGKTPLAPLDWTPVAQMVEPARVALYDLVERRKGVTPFLIQ